MLVRFPFLPSGEDDRHIVGCRAARINVIRDNFVVT